MNIFMNALQILHGFNGYFWHPNNFCRWQLPETSPSLCLVVPFQNTLDCGIHMGFQMPEMHRDVTENYTDSEALT